MGLKATVILRKIYIKKTYKGVRIGFLLPDSWNFSIENIGMSILKLSALWELG